jgi:NAD(P)-dependent dehydrogenase (short-subunit alcohol dehydrogenase family)
MTQAGLFDVSGEIVVITGVSGQMGHQYAKAFLQAGARVVGLDVTEGKRSLELGAGFPQYQFQTVDITSKSSLEAAFSAIEQHFGTPTVLVNNAGIDSPPSAPPEETGPFEEYPESSWDKVLDVNLKGVFLCCQVFGGRMARGNCGSIINVSSIYGMVSPDQGIYEFRRQRGEVFFKPVAYSASKSGLYNLTRYLGAYWAKNGVRVNTLTLAGVFNNQDPEFLKGYCGRIPIGRMANADEYNGAVLFLASRASSYMTGSNLVVDGGWTAI